MPGRHPTVEYFDVIVTPLFLSYQMGAETILTGNAREVAPVRPRTGEKTYGHFRGTPGYDPDGRGVGGPDFIS